MSSGSCFQLGPIGRRSVWSARLLKLECTRGSGSEPGLLLLQIDGLGWRQFQAALKRGRLPFLRGLLQRSHAASQVYSGVPSTTAAVQGELLYGVRQAVPAFAYVERETGRDRVMYDPESAERVAQRLEREGEGLLTGGTAYSHVYTGGSTEARYCIQTLNLRSFFQSASFSRVSLVTLFHLGHILRVVGLSVLEIALALTDVCRGLMRGRSLLPEFKFIFSRIGASIVLRELIRFRAKVDTVRGVPVVSANLVGYDEHAHRRGPSSSFAHWTLRGIDGVIRDIYRTALRSGCRDYRLVVYSDHGQEEADSYPELHGRTLAEAVAEAFRNGPLAAVPVHSVDAEPPYKSLYQRARSFLWADPRSGVSSATLPDGIIRLAALGPLGHLYLPYRPSDPVVSECARRLATTAEVPLVLYRKNDEIFATTRDGTFRLPGDAGEVLGAAHPRLQEAAEDLMQLTRHPDAGDLILSGWSPGRRPLTFVTENGAHGGPGTEETCGFAVLPRDLGTGEVGAPLRVMELRRVLTDYLEQGASG